MIMSSSPRKVRVIILEEHGKAVTQTTAHRLVDELFNKARPEKNVESLIINGPKVNNCTYLLMLITELSSLDEWEVIFYHKGQDNAPILLHEDDKRNLPEALSFCTGTSADAIFGIIAKSA